MLFHSIDDKQAIIRNTKTGVYKQAKLYSRNGEMYVGHSGGFLRLRNDGVTSNPNILWIDIEAQYDRALVGGALRVAPQLRAVA